MKLVIYELFIIHENHETKYDLEDSSERIFERHQQLHYQKYHIDAPETFEKGSRVHLFKHIYLPLSYF